MECDGFESILTSRTPFVPDTDFCELHVEIIGDDEDIGEWNFIKIDDCCNRFSR